jgi:hypothetical protein
MNPGVPGVPPCVVVPRVDAPLLLRCTFASPVSPS